MGIQQVPMAVDDLTGQPYAVAGTVEAEPIRFPIGDGEWRGVYLSPESREKFYERLKESLEPFVSVSHVVQVDGEVTSGSEDYIAPAIEAPAPESAQSEPAEPVDFSAVDAVETEQPDGPEVEVEGIVSLKEFDPTVNYETLLTKDERSCARAWGQKYHRRYNLPEPGTNGRVPKKVLWRWMKEGKPVAP